MGSKRILLLTCCSPCIFSMCTATLCWGLGTTPAVIRQRGVFICHSILSIVIAACGPVGKTFAVRAAVLYEAGPIAAHLLRQRHIVLGPWPDRRHVAGAALARAQGGEGGPQLGRVPRHHDIRVAQGVFLVIRHAGGNVGEDVAAGLRARELLCLKGRSLRTSLYHIVPFI